MNPRTFSDPSPGIQIQASTSSPYVIRHITFTIAQVNILPYNTIVILTLECLRASVLSKGIFLLWPYTEPSKLDLSAFCNRPTLLVYYVVPPLLHCLA